MLDDLLEHFRGTCCVVFGTSLSGPYWSLTGFAVDNDGNAGPGWSVFWYDPPSGPP